MGKQMNKRIDRVIHERFNYSLGKIAGLMKDRLSLYGLYALHDEVELNSVKMRSEMHTQNEKLEFLFKTLAERSERRSNEEETIVSVQVEGRNDKSLNLHLNLIL